MGKTTYSPWACSAWITCRRETGCRESLKRYTSTAEALNCEWGLKDCNKRVYRTVGPTAESDGHAPSACGARTCHRRATKASGSSELPWLYTECPSWSCAKPTCRRLRLNEYNVNTALIHRCHPAGVTMALDYRVRLTPGRVRPIPPGTLWLLVQWSHQEHDIVPWMTTLVCRLRCVIARGTGRGAVPRERPYRVVAQYSGLPWETKRSNTQPDGRRPMHSLLLVNRGRCRLNPWYPGT